MIKNKYIRFLFHLIFLILPIIGMFISDAVNWNIFDFILMGFLLISLGFTLNYVLVKKITGKIVYVLLILFVFILIWVELAVGIFNSPFSGS